MLNLIIGGAGSGKSAYAESLTLRLPGRRVYLATMQSRDAESLKRIERHRVQRAPHGFLTVECPTDLAGTQFPENANILLEDLSNLLANEMFSQEGGGAEAVRRGLESLLSRCANLTVVTNEVFSGGADYAPETLAYMKELALLNRELAAKSDFCAELVCGLPHILKGEEP